jgi:hypothetical protein
MLDNLKPKDIYPSGVEGGRVSDSGTKDAPHKFGEKIKLRLRIVLFTKGAVCGGGA